MSNEASQWARRSVAAASVGLAAFFAVGIGAALGKTHRGGSDHAAKCVHTRAHPHKCAPTHSLKRAHTRAVKRSHASVPLAVAAPVLARDDEQRSERTRAGRGARALDHRSALLGAGEPATRRRPQPARRRILA